VKNGVSSEKRMNSTFKAYEQYVHELCVYNKLHEAVLHKFLTSSLHRKLYATCGSIDACLGPHLCMNTYVLALTIAWDGSALGYPLLYGKCNYSSEHLL
jgi:hypothetical protein